MHLLGEKLRNYHVVLGSASPRRKELLAGLDVPFEVLVLETEERIDETLPLELIPQSIAEQKFQSYIHVLQDDVFLITADTLVFCEGRPLGKPRNVPEAKDMIRFLSGKTHTVVTGVCVGTKRKRVAFFDKTLVTFSPINERDIEYYIDSYKPLDKAGAYGVQEWIGYMGIEKIEGSFYTVMGLPVHRLYETICAYEE